MTDPIKPTRELVKFLTERLEELIDRPGQFSVIVQTPTCPLRTGKEQEVWRADFAYKEYRRTRKQLLLKEIPPYAGIPFPINVAAPTMSDAHLPDGVDFSRPDRLSTKRFRHVLAKRRHPKAVGRSKRRRRQ